MHVANGSIATESHLGLAQRLVKLHNDVVSLVHYHGPNEAAVEETFVNKNPDSTLKLGLARGVILLAPALARLSVSDYTPNRVKKTVVGVGHANKKQVQAMVGHLLPGVNLINSDAADALAVAICHAQFRKVNETRRDIEKSDLNKGIKESVNLSMKRAISAALAKEAIR